MDALKSYFEETLGLSSILVDQGVGPDGSSVLSQDSSRGASLPPLLAVVLETPREALAQDQWELLTRILEAGLKVSLSRVQWLTFPPGQSLITLVNNATGRDLSALTPLLVFGASWSGEGQEKERFGRIFEAQGVQILVTHGLREISESELVKREAWTQLQKFRGLIRSES